MHIEGAHLIFYCNAAFMHDFYNGKLPEVFLNFFKSVKKAWRNYNTRFTEPTLFQK